MVQLRSHIALAMWALAILRISSAQSSTPTVISTPLSRDIGVRPGESAFVSMRADNLSREPGRHDLRSRLNIHGRQDEHNAAISFQAALKNNGFAVTQWEFISSDGILHREITARVINTEALRQRHELVQINFTLVEFLGKSAAACTANRRVGRRCNRTTADIGMAHFTIALLSEREITDTEPTGSANDSTNENGNITIDSGTGIECTPSASPGVVQALSNLPPGGHAIIGVLVTVTVASLVIAFVVPAVALTRSKNSIPGTPGKHQTLS